MEAGSAEEQLAGDKFNQLETSKQQENHMNIEFLEKFLKHFHKSYSEAYNSPY
jgi:hypothetical protein